MSLKNFILRSGLVVLVLVILVSALMFWSFMTSPFNDKQFSREVWIASADIIQNNPRINMADDIRRRIIKRGMSREEVVRILGKPDGSQKDPEYLKPGISEVIEYYLGYTDYPIAIAMDPYILYIHLDKSGHVVRVEYYES
ncbi:MAG: hypothetical protein ACYC27_05945 [Armatimonadota bacterium]